MIKLFTIFTLFHTLLFASFSGKIIDSNSLKPIFGAMISDSKTTVKSDENGTFYLKTDENLVHIKSYGYRALAIKDDTNTTKLKLEPINIKALYLTFWGANLNSKTIKRMMKIIDEKEVNAIVVDVKNEYGSTSYKTSFAQANSYGAWRQRTIKDMKKFMDFMKSKNIYTIARIVTFKDELQALNNQDYAIKKKMVRYGETMMRWHGLIHMTKEVITILSLSLRMPQKLVLMR